MTQPLSLMVCGRRRSSSDLSRRDEIEDNNPSISQLVSALRDAFQEAEFDRIEAALVAREADLKRRNEILKEKVELGLLDRLKLAQDLEALKESRPPEKVKEEDKEVISQLRRKNNRLEMEKSRLDREYEALESRILGLEDDTTKLVNEMLLGSGRNEGTIMRDNGGVLNLENVFECLIENQANGNLQISGEAKLDRVIEKQREEYATLEKRHKFEMEKMLKVENEFAALKRKHQLQLEEKDKVENELKACRVEIEGLKVENEVKKLKEVLKAVEENHKSEYKALEQKHQSHLLEVENELKRCKAELQGLKEEQSTSDEKYQQLLEEVNKHRKEEDEVVNFDPQRQSKEVESEPNVVLEDEISRLDKFRNAKHLGSKNMDKRSKNSGMPDGSRKQKCIVTPNHVINVENDFCGSVPASTSPRGNSVRNSGREGGREVFTAYITTGTSKSSNADTILLSDSDDDCAPAKQKNFGLKRKRASSPNASNNNNGGHNFKRESFPTSENKQSWMLGRCDSLVGGYGIQNNPPNRDQETLRPSEEKVGEQKPPAKVNGESDSSSASMFSSDDSEDDDDINLDSMMLFTTNRS
ncbi:synaptonemal complex protein 1 isoform X2 [Rosa chinensis]|uniref:synaptonemal complex protein 1 isoform X2 n=1 Tax=Rosa chinensis TaxID=74649 RepID=UPI000D08AFFF|nr:synaptonemal complex protein 1 isoform X2 [Rosa chinensis]